ncbi:chemotaxis protein CheB [Paraburkholderia saeva]|uniref:protein-glutamate methylesterase n=1 Tax=Paraburkholderia saeva TaxID=2777537 RepID=A0A9N8S0F9_9BURK|nr:chemotaxis protein CheB [Paraburkholderia saeva]CAG4889361.1 Protein-glutamate methylesterase/protein-glutamine glutaminase [Paraburkholderia saeva]CAG4894616.1 Protein-glutamate methylesterase/protein-glutamine glutaminase [Paraburkholderia saeva]CAG4917819.1 Protein-glutamate methylesterase/protein-glutamine glutaminase [Paraburkholderia saeva]
MVANRLLSKRRLEQTEAHKAPARTFDVVVIGASAGGIEALNVLLPALPARFAAAVLVVTHLPPATPSYLLQALTGRCALPVIEPDAGERIAPGQVYVAPPGYHTLVEDDGTVALSVGAAVRFSRPSIDVLMESAAWVYRERMLAILLSGANDDGTRGFAAVRAAGGETWAQSPETATSPEMPQAAIQSGAVNEVLDPNTMAGRLAAWPQLPPQ